jgi:hypothetical protein
MGGAIATELFLEFADDVPVGAIIVFVLLDVR